ncbi:MAG: hypothetical protein PUC98_02355, partial [Clostridiales bacterium]|nr:hypothetical protein [Clostridiales bacterium]
MQPEFTREQPDSLEERLCRNDRETKTSVLCSCQARSCLQQGLPQALQFGFGFGKHEMRLVMV